MNKIEQKLELQRLIMKFKSSPVIRFYTDPLFTGFQERIGPDPYSNEAIPLSQEEAQKRRGLPRIVEIGD